MKTLSVNPIKKEEILILYPSDFINKQAWENFCKLYGQDPKIEGLKMTWEKKEDEKR